MKKYDYFFFLYDRVRGPYNKNKLKCNWIEYYTNYLDKYNLIISAYGTSPMGKLFRMPFITMRFMAMNKRTFKLLIKKKYFTDNIFSDKDDVYHNNPFNHVEIKLSYLLLENNINYVVLDKNGIYDLNLLKFYKEKNWSRLFEITQDYHKIGDKTTIDRIFWLGKSMKKIFELKDKTFIRHMKCLRKIKYLERW